MSPTIIAKKHHQHYSLIISGSRLGYGIGVDISDLIQAGLGNAKLGRDAKALQAEMLRFPGFDSIDSLRARLLG